MLNSRNVYTNRIVPLRTMHPPGTEPYIHSIYNDTGGQNL